MKKIFCMMTVAVLLCCGAACGGNNGAATRKGFIEDVDKGYFEGLPEASCTTVDLSDYVEKNGLIVDYTVKSDLEEVATVSVEGDILTVQLHKEGSAQITVDVQTGGKKDFDLSFSVTARQYSRIACVGDSLTYGHSWHNESYPVYLQERFGSGVMVENFGVNGAAVTNRGDSSFRLKYDTLAEYRESLAFSPEVVLIMLGSNDGYAWQGSESSYLSEYEKLVKAYRDNGAESVFVMTAPPTLAGNAFNIPDAVLEESVYPLQCRFARDAHLPLIDVRQAIQAKEGGYESLYRPGDGVHFSVEGANFVASLVFNELIKL